MPTTPGQLLSRPPPALPLTVTTDPSSTHLLHSGSRSAGLAAEADLSPAQRERLAARFVDHPGRTITDPARMTRPVETLHATYIASLPEDTEPLPAHVAALQAEPTWTVERIHAGHWPMVSFPTQLASLLETAAARSLR